MKLSRQLKKDKNLRNYIENKIRSNKNAYMGEGVNVKLILNNRKKLMNRFISRNKGLQNEYNELKTENQKFYKTYKNILDFRDNQSYLEKKYGDNFVVYQQKGYKIPNLTTKSNIIKYSPLLMEGQEHINKFFLQDLYLLNKKFKTVWTYDKLYNYITENNITFNGHSEEDDDDNEKDGINSNIFLNHYDLLTKKALKDKKDKKVYNGLDINNWFKQDLYADPFLTQGNSLCDDNLFDANINKAYIVNKQIEKLIKDNDNIKKGIINMIKIYNKNRKGRPSKRHSVNILELNNTNDNKELNKTNIIFKQRSKSKKLSLPHKKLVNIKFENFDENINKNKKEEKNNILDKKDSMRHAKTRLIRRNNVKSTKNNLIENNTKSNTSTKRNNSNSIIKNIKNIDLYKQKFNIYSGKEPKYLFSLMKDVKVPFNKSKIINIFSKKYKLSKIKDLNSRYNFLEKYLCKGLHENYLSD